MNERFWMVFSDRPTMSAKERHNSRQSAIDEATRLAKTLPGERFYVAAFTGFAVVSPVQWTECERNRSGLQEEGK